MDNQLQLTEYRKDNKYQKRNPPKIEISNRQRHCYSCNHIIKPKIKHITMDNHLSTGLRSDIHICHNCLVIYAEETK